MDREVQGFFTRHLSTKTVVLRAEFRHTPFRFQGLLRGTAFWEKGERPPRNTEGCRALMGGGIPPGRSPRCFNCRPARWAIYLASGGSWAIRGSASGLCALAGCPHLGGFGVDAALSAALACAHPSPGPFVGARGDAGAGGAVQGAVAVVVEGVDEYLVEGDVLPYLPRPPLCFPGTKNCARLTLSGRGMLVRYGLNKSYTRPMAEHTYTSEKFVSVTHC